MVHGQIWCIHSETNTIQVNGHNTQHVTKRTSKFDMIDPSHGVYDVMYSLFSCVV